LTVYFVKWTPHFATSVELGRNFGSIVSAKKVNVATAGADSTTFEFTTTTSSVVVGESVFQSRRKYFASKTL
jgi:hypothetical protein